MEKIKKISYGTVIKVAITIAIFSQIIIQSISSKSTFAQEAEITQTTETVSLPEQTITVYEQTDTPPPTYEEKSQTITVYETENSQPTVTSFDISTSENGSGDSLNNTTINSPLEITGSIITGENQEREIITNEFGSGDLGNSIELSGKNNESLIDDTDNKEISLITKDRTTEINTGEEIEEDTNILDFYNEMDFPGTDCIVTEPCTGNNFKSQNKNFFKENNKIKKNIRTKYSQGIITESIDLVSDDETIKIKINAGTKALTRERKAYQGIIYKPETIETTSYPDENNNIFKTIKVKTDENIDFIDKIDMTPKTVQITSTVDSIFLGNTIDVFFSEDNGETRSHQTTTEAKEQDGETTISFNTTHFTIFSFGLSTGSFVINNDATTATGFNVTLQNNVTGATLMKFGNTPAARDAANWTGYSSSFNWTLTGTDELKTVYAAFSNSGGTTAFTTDRIYLDTNSVVMASGLIRHITSSNSGAVFFDSSTNGDNATGFGGYTVTTLGAESIVNFNGTNAYLQRNDQIVTAFPFTIGARVRPSRLSGVQRIAGLARSSANNRYRGIGLNGNKASVILRNTLESITNSSSSLVTGQRYYIVGVFNSTTDIRLYVNGISEATASPLVTFSSNAANVVSIGRQSTSTPTRYFSGAIDETRVYNINLPVPRIQLLSALTGTFQTLTTNNDSPTLSGTVGPKTSSVIVTISGINYTGTVNSSNGTRTIPNETIGPFANGTYNVTLKVINAYGYSGSFVFTSALSIVTGPSINYSTTGATTGSVKATVTGLPNTTIITNNNATGVYTFTNNGTFTFEYLNLDGSTGEITATVERIGTVTINSASGLQFTGLLASNILQEAIQSPTIPFSISDQKGLNSGYYTTLSATPLSGLFSTIPSSSIFIQATGIQLLSGSANPLVTISTGLSSFQAMSGVFTYIMRNTAPNNYLRGIYGNTPQIKILIPAYQNPGSYNGTLTFTIYEY